MRAIEHFKTITHHRHLVQQYCFRLGLYYQGLTHDLSKYSPSEFWRGVKYYQGYRSPNDAERRENGVSLAWLHHKGRNRHHFEYWWDYNPKTRRNEPVEMPIRFFAEMFCDRVAASKIYMQDKYTQACPLQYFQRSTAQKVGTIHPSTAAMLTEMLELLANEGEDAAFAELRRRVKAAKQMRTRHHKRITNVL